MTEEFQVNTYINGEQSLPKVAVLSNDNFVIAWRSNLQDGSDFGVYGQLFNSKGTKFGEEFQVNTYTDSIQTTDDAIKLANGNFAIIWTSDYWDDYGGGQDGSSSSVHAQVFNSAGGKIGSDIQLNTHTYSEQTMARAALLNDGRFITAWASWGQDGEGTRDVYAQLFDTDASKIGGEFKVNAIVNAGDPHSVFSLSTGGFVICWVYTPWAGGPVDYNVYLTIYNEDVVKLDEFRVNTYTSNHQRFVDGISLGSNFVVTWASEGQDGDGYGIFAQIYSNDGVPVGEEFQVNTYTAGSQTNPSVAALSNDQFIITWASEGQDGDGYGIFAQIYTNDGVPVREEFQINTYTAGSQTNPSVAALSNNGYVITWQSEKQDSSDYGIFARIFNEANNSTMVEFNIIEAGYYNGTEGDDHFILRNGNNDVTIMSKGGNDLFTVYPDGNGTIAILDFDYEKDFIDYLHNGTCTNCSCVEIIN